MKTIVEDNSLAPILGKAFVFAKGRDDLLISIQYHLAYLSKQPSTSQTWNTPLPFAVHSMQFLLRFRKIGETIEVVAESVPRPDSAHRDC